MAQVGGTEVPDPRARARRGGGVALAFVPCGVLESQMPRGRAAGLFFHHEAYAARSPISTSSCVMYGGGLLTSSLRN